MVFARVGKISRGYRAHRLVEIGETDGSMQAGKNRFRCCSSWKWTIWKLKKNFLRWLPWQGKQELGWENGKMLRTNFRVSEVEEPQEEMDGFRTVLGRVSSRVEIMLLVRAGLSCILLAACQHARAITSSLAAATVPSRIQEFDVCLTQAWLIEVPDAVQKVNIFPHAVFPLMPSSQLPLLLHRMFAEGATHRH